MIHGDARLVDHGYTIWNLLKADLSSITKGEMCQPAATDRAAATYVHRIKVAIVAQEIHAVEILSHYIERFDEPGSTWELGLFDCMSDAVEWAKP